MCRTPTGEHRFWNTQPVPKQGEIINDDGVIEGDKELHQIRQEPFPLQADFEWFLVDINDEKEVKLTSLLIATALLYLSLYNTPTNMSSLEKRHL